MPKSLVPTQFDSSCLELENLVERLEFHSRSKAPKRILINPADDLFAENVEMELRDSVMLTAYMNPQHSYQLVTNQIGEVLKYLTEETFRERLEIPIKKAFDAEIENALFEMPSFELPIPNILIGTKISNQKETNETLSELRQISVKHWQTWIWIDPMTSQIHFSDEWKFLKWIVLEGRADKTSDPIHPYWLRTIRDFCTENQIPFFFKSWGDWMPKNIWEESLSKKTSVKKWNQFDWGSITLTGEFHQFSLPNPLRSREECLVLKIGKSKTKSILDGQTFHQFPS